MDDKMPHLKTVRNLFRIMAPSFHLFSSMSILLQLDEEKPQKSAVRGPVLFRSAISFSFPFSVRLISLRSCLLIIRASIIAMRLQLCDFAMKLPSPMVLSQYIFEPCQFNDSTHSTKVSKEMREESSSSCIHLLLVCSLHTACEPEGCESQEPKTQSSKPRGLLGF